MAGTELLIQRMTTHDYTSLASGQESGQTILAEVNVTQWREGTLVVLLKEASVRSGAVIHVGVVAIERTDDVPGKIFADRTNLVASIDITDNTSSAEHLLLLDGFTSGFPANIAVVVTAESASGTDPLTATFETRLSLKN